MSSLIPSGGASGTGSVTLLAPNTNSTQTQTLPDATGTVMVSGNMPAFSAYLSNAAQSVSSNTWTKITLNAEEFDTANCFDSTTNYRFTPNVAGYYQITGAAYGDATTTNPVNVGCAIYKNGSVVKYGLWATNATALGTATVSALIYFNGTTDYIEMYGRLGNGSGVQFDGGGSVITYMCGYLARAA